METQFVTIRSNFAGIPDTDDFKPIILSAPKPLIVHSIEVKLEYYMDVFDAALGGASVATDITYLPRGLAYSDFSNADDVDYFDFDHVQLSYFRGEWVLWNDFVHVPTYLDALEEEYHPMQHILSRHETVYPNQRMNTADRLVFKADTRWPLLVIAIGNPTVLIEGTIKIVYSSSITITGVEVGEAACACGAGCNSIERKSRA